MKNFSLGLGAALIASLATSMVSLGSIPVEPPRAPKKRRHLHNYGEPVIDSTPESKRARRRRLAKGGKVDG